MQFLLNDIINSFTYIIKKLLKVYELFLIVSRRGSLVLGRKPFLKFGFLFVVYICG